MKTFSLKLPETLYGELASFADDQGRSRSAVVRDALVELLARKRVPARGSALALIDDLAGSIDGPEDLSVNESYLDDLGR